MTWFFFSVMAGLFARQGNNVLGSFAPRTRFLAIGGAVALLGSLSFFGAQVRTTTEFAFIGTLVGALAGTFLPEVVQGFRGGIVATLSKPKNWIWIIVGALAVGAYFSPELRSQLISSVMILGLMYMAFRIFLPKGGKKK